MKPNPLRLARAAIRRITYRTDLSTPHPSYGLTIHHHGWGRRTVHDPAVPDILEARREAIVLHGLEDLDDLLWMDSDTIAALTRTRNRMLATGKLPQPSGRRTDQANDPRPALTTTHR